MDEAERLAFFFEIHRGLPREGPGDAASTRRAFGMLPGLPPAPRILDLGCGPGRQSLDLLAATDGTVTAVDLHAPFLDRLDAEARRRGVRDRLEIVCADMTDLDLPPASFDVIWSEGAVYLAGFEDGLRYWRTFLRDGGGLAVTELTWLRPDPPEDVRRFWAAAYPALQDAPANLAVARRAGYREVGHFTLPEAAWWADYYTPLEHRLAALREAYRDDPGRLALLDEERREIDLYRRHADAYGYVFYVLRKPAA